MLQKMEVSLWSLFSMALAAGAFLMRSCDAPADTVRRASASAMKPVEEGRCWLLWKLCRRGWGHLRCDGT